MWPAPEPQPCPVDRAWIGPCGEVDRTKCQHFRHLPLWPLCQCGRPALAECDSASSLVCGAPVCHTGWCERHGGHCPPKIEPFVWLEGKNPAYKPRSEGLTV
jgi:hypothetical protein